MIKTETEGEIKLNTIEQDEFLSLASYRAEPCISLFMPMFKDERGHYDGNRIHLKNNLQAATQELEQRGYNPPEIQALLKGAWDLVDDAVFWAHQQEGLGILISPEFTRLFPLTHVDEETIFVDRQFAMRPFLPLVTNSFEGYLLTLSQNAAEFLHVTRDNMQEVTIQDMPTSLAEAMAFDDPENQLQSHSATASTEKGAIFHSHHPSDEENSRLTRYVQQISNALAQHLGDESQRIPIVVAGAAELIAIFRNTADLQSDIVPQQIEGNVEHLAAADLHSRAWEIIKDYHLQWRYDAARRYKDLDHAGLTASTVEDVVRAAHFGQIDTLFVVTTGVQMGNYNEENSQVTLVDDEQAAAEDDVDLLDLAAVKTLENGGTVIPLEGPADPPMAAILRYAVKEAQKNES